MTNLKCNLCGAINSVADEVCTVCGAELQPHDESLPPFGSDDAPRPWHTVIGRFDGAGDVIGPTISLFFKNIWLITKIVFVIMAPFEVFKALSLGSTEPDAQLGIGILALQLLSNALIVPALFYSLMQVLETGTAPSVNEAYRWGLGRIPKLSLSAIMSWFLVGLGTLLCIVPGIILSCAFHVVYPVAVFEKHSPVDVLRRSYELTDGHRLSIFGAGIVMALLGMVCVVPVSITVGVLAANGVSFLPLQIVLAIYTDIVTEIQTVFSLVVYLSILRTLGRGHSILE